MNERASVVSALDVGEIGSLCSIPWLTRILNISQTPRQNNNNKKMRREDRNNAITVAPAAQTPRGGLRVLPLHTLFDIFFSRCSD